MNPHVHLFKKELPRTPPFAKECSEAVQEICTVSGVISNHEAFELGVWQKVALLSIDQSWENGLRFASYFGYPSCSQGFKQILPLDAVVWVFKLEHVVETSRDDLNKEPILRDLMPIEAEK